MLNQLPKLVARPKKRLGRGMGSGKGSHTSSRGQKGQKSRTKISPLFEGTKAKKSLIQRLPLQRGKGKQKPRFAKPKVIKLSLLNSLPEGSTVNVALLIKNGLIRTSETKNGVKILNGGELTKKLIIRIPVSLSAREKITKAGGQII